jgi:hypothetical protein
MRSIKLKQYQVPRKRIEKRIEPIKYLVNVIFLVLMHMYSLRIQKPNK